MKPQPPTLSAPALALLSERRGAAHPKRAVLNLGGSWLLLGPALMLTAGAGGPERPWRSTARRYWTAYERPPAPTS